MKDMRQNRSTMSLRTLFGTIATVVALLQSAPCSALSCDELKADVEANIRANGVSAFSVSVVEIGVTSVGKVLGTCELGAKKLVYTLAATNAQTHSAPAKNEKKAEVIITECKDGLEPVHGECHKN